LTKKWNSKYFSTEGNIFNVKKSNECLRPANLKEGQISENWPENPVFLLQCSYIWILELRRNAILQL